MAASAHSFRSLTLGSSSLSSSSGGLLLDGKKINPAAPIIVRTSAGVETTYATAALALASSTSTSVMIFGNGTHTITANLCVPGSTTTIYLYPGAILSMSTTDVNMFDDTNVATTLIIGGFGEIQYTSSTGVPWGSGGGTGTASVFKLRHPSSRFDITLRSLTHTGTASNDSMAVNHIDGVWFAKIDDFITLDSGAGTTGGLYWKNGTHHTIMLRSVCGSGYNVWTECPGVLLADMTGEMSVQCQIMIGDNVSRAPVLADGNTFARLWLDILELRCAASYATIALDGSAIATIGPVVYLTSQKVIGVIANDGGELHVTTQKHALGATNIMLVNFGAGTSFIKIGKMETTYLELALPTPDPELGAAIICHTGYVSSSTGTHQIEVGNLTMTTIGHGVNITAGTLRLNGLINTTFSVATYNPIVKSGGTLILDNARLVSGGSRKSIDASTSQNVVAIGSAANIEVDTDITITTPGGLIIDPNIV